MPFKFDREIAARVTILKIPDKLAWILSYSFDIKYQWTSNTEYRKKEK